MSSVQLWALALRTTLDGYTLILHTIGHLSVTFYVLCTTELLSYAIISYIYIFFYILILLTIGHLLDTFLCATELLLLNANYKLVKY